MNYARILHQQTMQLRWTFLICFGLIMVLPIEEGFVNVMDDAGFYTTQMAIAAVFISPLLAGLLACVNVQADLDEKRYNFWRSKPVGATSFMTIKYITGLLLALVLAACPIVFGWVSNEFYEPHDNVIRGLLPLFLNLMTIVIMVYSVCFLCNVLIRKTARAWLIGMAASALLLLVPFLLPLHFKDVAGDVLLAPFGIYLVMTLGASVIAWGLSLAAVVCHWHLRTNLKGLLWSGAAVLFILALFLAHQVANVQVLDEISPDNFTGFLDKAGDTIISPNFTNIQVGHNDITLHPVTAPLPKAVREKLQVRQPLYEMTQGLDHHAYPSEYPVFSPVHHTIFGFSIDLYSRDQSVGENTHRVYEKMYIRLTRLMDGVSVTTFVMDISEMLENGSYPMLAMRQVDDKLLVFVRRSCLVTRITEDGTLEVIDKIMDRVKTINPYSTPNRREKRSSIPLVPVEGISMEDRVKLSIDLNYWYGYSDGRFEKHSLADVRDDGISFVILTESGISRYDVDDWDSDKIYFHLRDRRPFTFLERIFGSLSRHDRYFIDKGRAYAYNDFKFMVFDFRADRIRKLGHFERLSDDFRIEDLVVLENRDILMSVITGRSRQSASHHRSYINSLYLLQRP